MSARREGFTLLEVMVALTVGGFVALLVLGSLRAGLDTGDRLALAREEDERAVIVRALLEDALRHASEGTGADFAFAIDDGVDRDGVPHDGLRIATRGVLAPRGASPRYVLAVRPDVDGLRVVAEPEDALAGPRLESVLPAVHGLDVRALSAADGAWHANWANVALRPAAVELRFLARDGAEERMVVRTGLGGAP